MTETLADRLRELAKYEGVFASPEFTIGNWADTTPDAHGVCQMPWFKYSEKAFRFLKDAYAFGWVVNFDWREWAATPAGRRLLADPDLVGQLDADDLARLLTVVIRGDHFSECKLAGAYRAGLLSAIVRRAELANAC